MNFIAYFVCLFFLLLLFSAETTAVGRVRRSLHFEVGESSQVSKQRENKCKTPLKQLESQIVSSLDDLLTPSKATGSSLFISHTFL